MRESQNVAIMQPYFFPYIGYWQLLCSVDKFVVYDNIQFTKKGWMNRNRYLLNDSAEVFTITLKKDSDYLNVNERVISERFENDKMKLLRRLESAYIQAPFYEESISIFKESIDYPNRNLFQFIFNSIQLVVKKLSIKTEIIVSSSLPIDHLLKGQDKVIAICKELNAKGYLNPIGGKELYQQESFRVNNIELSFQKIKDIQYHQYGKPFVHSLSILDVLMFNGIEGTKRLLGNMAES